MMTLRGRQLLAAADPWGADGLGACGGYYGLGAVTDVPLIGGELGKTGAAGEKIGAGLEAGDINAVAEGAKEGIAAVQSGAAKLEGAWNDAEKFFISMGGTVTVPSFGFKGPNVPMWSDPPLPPNVDLKKVQTIKVSTPDAFIRAVADGWMFLNPDWKRFQLSHPKPGGVTGQVWNPFGGGKWQAAGQGIPLPGGGSATSDWADPYQRDIDIRAAKMAPYLALAATRVSAKQYKAANEGHLFEGQYPWGLVPLIAILTQPGEASVIARGLKFSTGPLAGTTYKRQRIKWIQALQKVVAKMPPNERPLNTDKLASATEDGTPAGKRITPNGNGATGAGAGGGAVALAAGAGLGLLWLLFA